MTTTDVTEAFFSAPNEVVPSNLSPATGDLLALLRARLAASRRTVLPARVNGVVRWYGIAPTDREARLLREELRCWLGPPVSTRSSDARGSSDPLDHQAALLAGDGTAVRIDVADGWQTTARQNVASLADLWSLAPERGVDQPRPVGRVLRQFYEGLLAADRAAAESSLDEIRARSLLSATNIRFLRLELLSALGTPEEVRDDASLRGISLLARPPAVTERLAAAADVLFIEPALAQGGDVDWPAVARNVEDAWPGLVSHLGQVTTVPTARCLALGELHSPTPSRPLAELVQRFPSDPVVQAATTAARLLGAPLEAAPLARVPSAVELYHQGDYWGALDAADGEPADRTAASVALAAAMNVGDSPSAVRALAVVERLPAPERDQLLASAVERAFYEELLGRTSAARVPAGWLDWLRGDWVDRPDLLSEWSRQWPRTPEPLADDADAIAEELLDSLNDSRRGRVRNGVPVFVDWLVGGGLPGSSVELATTVFDILLSSEPGRVERQAALLVLEEVLSTGCTSREYAELLDAVSRQLASLGPRDANWLAQCLDLLLLFSSQDPVRRNGLFADALGAAASWAARAEAPDLTVLELVFGAAGIVLPRPHRAAAVDGGASLAPTLRPLRVVGIYSLLESAALVAADWIRRLYPDADVRISSDYVSSPALTALVRSADVMLVQTSRAKHPATAAIERAADPSRVVLVHGRGASSLVRALLAWAQGEPAAPRA